LGETVGRGGARRPAGSRRKRVLDIAGTLAVLIFYAPVMTLLMLGMRLRRGGPILEQEETVGLGGRTFGRWRFRPAAEDDVCADIIERSGLTYLPSAINVLAGEMSLVGPEPHGTERSRYLQRGNPDYERRFEARPGMIWPRAEDGRSALVVELAYLAEWRTRLDLKIMGLHAFDGLFGEASEAG
jgi:lipopolysaccharide/colanic/teichoic acid biosynthesis glycosyltransferase